MEIKMKLFKSVMNKNFNKFILNKINVIFKILDRANIETCTIILFFLVLGFLHGVRSKFTEFLLTIDSKDSTHSCFRNVVSKFTSKTVQEPQNQKRIFISLWKYKIKVYNF
jgi:hypothetical protein